MSVMPISLHENVCNNDTHIIRMVCLAKCLFVSVHQYSFELLPGSLWKQCNQLSSVADLNQ